MGYRGVCGFALDGNVRFCPGCGTPVSSEKSSFSDSWIGDAGSAITADNIFNASRRGSSDLFSYSRLGKGFTGDISLVRDRVRRTVSDTPPETLRGIAGSNMADVRQRLSQTDDSISDRNWKNMVDFMKNGLPAAIVSYFYDPSLASEVKNIMDRLKALSREIGQDLPPREGRSALGEARRRVPFALRDVRHQAPRKSRGSTRGTLRRFVTAFRSLLHPGSFPESSDALRFIPN